MRDGNCAEVCVAATGMDLLALLQPLALPDFLSRHWEREPLLLTAKHDLLDRLLGEGDLESLIAWHGRSGQPPFSVAKNSAVGPRHTSRPLPDARRAYDAGETIFVPEIHLRWGPFADFCRMLETAFRHPVGATLVFSPPNAQGLTPHFDAAAVFAMQISGEKTWKVARPVREKPLFGDPLTDLPALPEPHVDYRLTPGDVLYVPMGFPHIALSGAAPSVHVSVYINCIRARDMIARALALAADADVAFRQPLAPGLLGSTDGATAIAALFRDLADRLASGFDAEATHGALVHEMLGQMHPHPAARFNWGKAVLDSDQPLRHAPGLLPFVSQSDGAAVIAYPGGQTRGPADIFRTLVFVAETPRFRVRDLPGLDAAGQRVLAERLLSEGVLVPDTDHGPDFGGDLRAAAPEHAALVPSV